MATNQNSNQKSNLQKIDVHQHMLPSVYTDALAELGIHGAGGVAFPEWSPESALQMMDAQGIATGFLSLSTPGVHFGDDEAAAKLARICNEYSASLAHAHATRFGGFAMLPLPNIDGALKEAEYALDELKLDGVVLLSSQPDGSYLGDPIFDPLMAELDRRSAVAFVHPTVPVGAPVQALSIPPFATEFVFDTSRAIINLIWNGVAERFPNIRFVFSHAGGTAPYLAGRWVLLDQSPQMEEKAPKGCMYYLRRFYYDTALSGSATALSALMELVPADQILFGSDYPFGPPPVSVGQWKGVEAFQGLSDAERLQISSGNASSLFSRLGR